MTEAGKRLLALIEPLYPRQYDYALLVGAVDDIEAEARKKALAEVYGYTRDVLDRIRAAVQRDLQEAAPDDPEMPPLYWDGWHAALYAVLAIIDTHPFDRGGGCMSRCRCGKTFSDPVHGPQPENIRRILAIIEGEKG